MAKLPEKIIQIASVHAPLIQTVVSACQNAQYLPLLEPELKKAEENGWVDLVKRIRKILQGQRKPNLLKGLDEEDAAIILAILVCVQNPDELKKLTRVTQQQGQYAPQALAGMIQAVWQNPVNKTLYVDAMLAQMQGVDQDIRYLARAIDKLCKKDFDLRDIESRAPEKIVRLIQDINNILDTE